MARLEIFNTGEGVSVSYVRFAFFFLSLRRRTEVTEGLMRVGFRRVLWSKARVGRWVLPPLLPSGLRRGVRSWVPVGNPGQIEA